MLERTIKETWTMEDVQELRIQLQKISSNAKPFYEQCELVSPISGPEIVVLIVPNNPVTLRIVDGY